MSNPLLTRILSAVIAGVLFLSVGYFYQGPGLSIIISILLFLGCLELNKILFDSRLGYWSNILTVSAIFFTYLTMTFLPEVEGLPVALAGVVFLMNLLVRANKKSDLSDFFDLIGRLLLGLFYLGLLPSFGVKLLFLSGGLRWFVCLLVIVFSGDILAYFFGISLGKHKLMPLISPKKTIEGAIGGLLGSIFAAGFCSLLFPNSNLSLFMVMGACVGPIAQMGDLFESSIKRLANLKDSGSIMPGHGGVLDRIDGVLFAAPVVYAFAIFFVF